jgi:hypothetical protein
MRMKNQIKHPCRCVFVPCMCALVLLAGCTTRSGKQPQAVSDSAPPNTRAPEESVTGRGIYGKAPVPAADPDRWDQMPEKAAESFDVESDPPPSEPSEPVMLKTTRDVSGAKVPDPAEIDGANVPDPPEIDQ